MPRLFLGFESVRAGNGGICRVARLMARVLAEEQTAGRCRVNGVVLSDPDPSLDIGLPLKLARGSRSNFVCAVTRGLFRSSHFIYDCGGMARSHQWLPLPRRPFLSFAHGIEVWQGTSHANQVSALLRADLLLVNTAYTRDRACLLNSHFSRAKVCWLATEADEPPGASTLQHKRPNVLILARLERYKGHEELIRCWPAVRSAVPDATLTIVGSGPRTDEFRKLVCDVGLSDREIELTGFIPEDRIDDYWRKAAVFAMPSRGEGFGLVYIEAMRYGLPVIGSIHDAAMEVNVDGETGYNVNLDKPDELPDRIISLLRNADQAKRLGDAGRQRWEQHFRFSAFRNRFIPILRDFITREG